jgi:hypothetical protein
LLETQGIRGQVLRPAGKWGAADAVATQNG